MKMICKDDEAPAKPIPITKPVFDEKEEKAVLNVLRTGWLVQGPRVAEFEDMFKTFIGAQHAIATTSCTTALHLALLAAGVGPGDEVLLPSFTFIATANAVEYTGATPVFVDIDLATYTIDPVKTEEYLARKRGNLHAKAIIPVSLFGLCADMERIKDIASRYNLCVIEDAACGFGAKRNAHFAGTETLAGCFSFHPRKSITTGEGGMLVTDDADYAERVRKMRDHGASKTDLARHLEQGGSLLPEFALLGYNYRMTDLQGAIGVMQMKKVDGILEARRKAAGRYNSLLACNEKIKAPFVPAGYAHAYQSYVCLYQGHALPPIEEGAIDWCVIEEWNKERNRMMAFLEKEGIAVRQGTHAVHTLSYYKKKYGLRDYDYPFSYIADRLSITIPLYCGLEERDQQRIVDLLVGKMGD
jgi:perosamine synthetase